jgi:hypothetical protein
VIRYRPADGKPVTDEAAKTDLGQLWLDAWPTIDTSWYISDPLEAIKKATWETIIDMYNGPENEYGMIDASAYLNYKGTA